MSREKIQFGAGTHGQNIEEPVLSTTVWHDRSSAARDNTMRACGTTPCGALQIKLFYNISKRITPPPHPCSSMLLYAWRTVVTCTCGGRCNQPSFFNLNITSDFPQTWTEGITAGIQVLPRGDWVVGCV